MGWTIAGGLCLLVAGGLIGAVVVWLLIVLAFMKSWH
jgi:hypothetical protein